jgi:hypothetical protein
MTLSWLLGYLVGYVVGICIAMGISCVVVRLLDKRRARRDREAYDYIRGAFSPPPKSHGGGRSPGEY